MISLPFVFLLFLAAIQFQKWLNSQRGDPIAAGFVLAAGAFGLQDLFQNYRVWSILNAARGFKDKDFSSFRWSIAAEPGDSLYRTLVLLGLVISIASLVFLLILARRDSTHQYNQNRTQRENIHKPGIW